MAVVGTAYVKVQAISTGLAEEIKRQVREAVRDASKDIDKDMEAAGRSGGKAYGKGFREEASKGIKEGLRDIVDDIDKDDGGNAERAGEGIGNRVGDGVTKSFKKNLGPKMSSVMSIAGKALKWGALLELLPSAIGVAMGSGAAAITGLTAAVTGLGAAAAGAGVAMVAGLAPLAQGMVLMKWAMDANADAAKNLTENWKGFKQEIGKAVGERMFDGLNIAVTTLKDKFVGNEGIMSAFRETGDVLGLVTRNIVDTATKDMGRFERVILNNNNALMGIGEGAAGLAESFVILLDAMGPITREIGDMVAKFGTWVRDTLAAKAASGELQATLMSLWNALKQVGRIVKDIGTGLFEIFRLAAPQAKDMGNSIEDIAKKFKEWTQSEAGQAKITQFFENSTRIAKELGKLIKDIFTGWGDGVKGMDTDSIISIIETMRTTWLPAIKDIVRQIMDALDIGESGDFFKNIGQSLQNVADSGIIGKIVQQLDDLVTTLGSIASSDAGTAIGGITAALMAVPGGVGIAAKALKGLFTSAGAGAGGGAGGGAGFLGGAKGLLKGGIIAFVVGEILSASSESFDSAWSGLWGSVLKHGGEVLGGALGAIGDFLAVPAQGLTAIVEWVFGDTQAAQAALDEGGAAWDTFTETVSEIDTWFTNRKSRGEIQETVDSVFGDFDGKAFTEATQIVADGIGTLASSSNDLGRIGPLVSQAWQGISNMLSRSPIPDDLKTKVATQWAALMAALEGGNQDLSKETGAIEATLHDLELMDPSFKPVADKIRQEMGLVTRLIPEEGDRWDDAWHDVFGKINETLTQPDVMGTGFQDWGTNIKSNLDQLKSDIENNADISGSLDKVFQDLKKVKPGDPQSVIETRDNIIAKLSAMGIDVTAAGLKVPEELSRALIEGAAKVSPIINDAVAGIPREALDAMNKAVETGNFTEAAALLSEGLAGLPEEVRKNAVEAAAAGHDWGPALIDAMEGSFDPARFKGMSETFGQQAIAELQKMPKNVVDAVAAAVAANDPGAITNAFKNWLSTIPPELQAQATNAAAAAGIIPKSVADAIVAGLGQANATLQPAVAGLGEAFNQVKDVPGLTTMKANITSGLQGVISGIEQGATDINSRIQSLAKAFENADPSFEPMRAKIVASLQAAGVDIASIAPTLLTPLDGLKPAAGAAGEAVGTATKEGVASGLRGTGDGAGRALSDVPVKIGEALTPAQQAAVDELLKIPPAAGAAVDPTAAIVASGLAGTPGAVSTALDPAAAAAATAMAPVPGAAGTAVAPTAGVVSTQLAPVPGAVSTALGPVPGAIGSALSGVTAAVLGPFGQAKTAAQQGVQDIKSAPNNLSGIQGVFTSQMAGIQGAVNAVMTLALNAMRSVLQMMLALPSAILGGIAGVVSAALGGIVGAVTMVMIGTLNVMSSYMSQIASKMQNFISTLRSQKSEIESILTAAEAAKTRAQQIATETKAALATAQADKASADAANAAAAAAKAAAAAAQANAFVPPQGWVLQHVLSAADFGALQGGWQPPYGRGLSGTRVAHVVMPEPRIKTTTTSTSTGERINVQVYIGQSELEEIIDKRVSYGDAQLDRKIRQGRRGVNQ